MNRKKSNIQYAKKDFDVAVIGAGPAGAAAAFHLAKNRRSVIVIDRFAFPRDKACGDGLTRNSIELLAELGIADELTKYQRIQGLRVITDTKGYQDRKYDKRCPGGAEYGVVIPRKELDHLICSKAVAAGAFLLEDTVVTGPIFSDGRVSGITIRRNGIEEEITARFFVAADGANSCFGRKVGLFNSDPWSRGYAIRGYYTGLRDLDGLFKVYVPLVDPDGKRTIAGYGWLFPLSGSTANVGIGFFPIQQSDFNLNLRRIFDHFVTSLRRGDKKLSPMKLDGRLRGGSLSCGMVPEATTGKGVILVGDAAGLVDPFTGEGIDTALESGKFAAEVLNSALSSPDPVNAELTGYNRLLEERYRDRFQTGKKFVRTYGFMWKLFENTCDIERPLFASVRSALIDFGGNGQHHAFPAPDQFRHQIEELGITDNLNKVQDQVALVIQSEFPLLSKVSVDLMDPTAAFIRSALVYLSGNFGKLNEQSALIGAVAIELSSLAQVIHDNILDGVDWERILPSCKQAPRINWGNMFALMAGNYLLAKSYELTAGLGSEISKLVSVASSDICTDKLLMGARNRKYARSDIRGLKTTEKRTATTFQLCCRLGSVLSRTPEPVAESLATYGLYLGEAYQLTNEILNMARPKEERQGSMNAIVMNGYLDHASMLVEKAKDSLNSLSASPAKAGLLDIADFVVDRVPNSYFRRCPNVMIELAEIKSNAGV